MPGRGRGREKTGREGQHVVMVDGSVCHIEKGIGGAQKLRARLRPQHSCCSPLKEGCRILLDEAVQVLLCLICGRPSAVLIEPGRQHKLCMRH